MSSLTEGSLWPSPNALMWTACLCPNFHMEALIPNTAVRVQTGDSGLRRWQGQSTSHGPSIHFKREGEDTAPPLPMDSLGAGPCHAGRGPAWEPSCGLLVSRPARNTCLLLSTGLRGRVSEGHGPVHLCPSAGPSVCLPRLPPRRAFTLQIGSSLSSTWRGISCAFCLLSLLLPNTEHLHCCRSPVLRLC